MLNPGSVEVEVSSDKRRKKAAKSITVEVRVGCLTSTGPLILHGFTSSDTVSIVKARVREEALELLLDPVELESRSMVLPDGSLLEDNETLGSLFNSGSSSSSSNSDLPSPCVTSKSLRYSADEELRIVRLCREVRCKEEAHEPNSFRELDPDELPWLRYHEVPIFKRPRTGHVLLPFTACPDTTTTLELHGDYKLFHYHKPIDKSCISSADTVKTSPYYILLAPSDNILLFVKLNDEDADIPIVAVTNLDPHHLDLLAFLTTIYQIVMGGISSIKIFSISRIMVKDWVAALDFLQVFGKSVSFLPADPATSADPCTYIHLEDDFIAKRLSKEDWLVPNLDNSDTTPILFFSKSNSTKLSSICFPPTTTAGITPTTAFSAASTTARHDTSLETLTTEFPP
ncbi:LOW QUALITY PROTEIN: hypothetical protein V2J09_014159 [Rumex salicifolius]